VTSRPNFNARWASRNCYGSGTTPGDLQVVSSIEHDRSSGGQDTPSPVES
jgi:hypothetical protein